MQMKWKMYSHIDRMYPLFLMPKQSLQGLLSDPGGLMARLQ